MRLEFEPNTSALPFVESETANQNATSEVERMLREGVKAAQEGNRGEARNLLLRVTESDANNENAWLWLASISEYPEELLVFLNNVLRVNPANERALEWHKATKSLLAKTLVQRGIDAVNDDRKDFARQCFEQALEHEAENEMAWLWMASVADSEDEKVKCFEKVLSVNPDNEAAQMSLKSIQSQKTQKLFNEALSTAFDGRHDAAMEMLATVLSQDSEIEDAWVLKSHLANSFEERAECFLKLRVLNPDNEMAKANLASWRMLADKVAAQPRTEEVQEVAVEAEQQEEVTAEAAQPEEVVADSFNESFNEEFSNEEVSAEFSDYPAVESLFDPEVDQPTNHFAVENEAENQVLEFSEQESANFDEPQEVQEQPQFFTEENLFTEEFSSFNSPTQELSLDSNVQPEQAFAEAEQETDQVQFTEPKAEETQSEEVKNFYEDLQTDQASFEAEDLPKASQEFSEMPADLAAETQAEESEMHWAFNELKNDHSQEPTESPEIHETQPHNYFEPEAFSQNFSDESQSNEWQPETAENSAEMSAETPSEEQKSEDWGNPSTDVSFNDFQPEAENHFEAQEVQEESAAPEMFLAEKPEESFSAEELVEVADAPVEEQVSMQSEEVVETPVKEEFSQMKSELVLCPFCNSENERQAFACSSCRTVLTLSDMEMLLKQQNADLEKLHKSVGSLERENESYGLSAEQLASLGIGHINLKNFRQGFFYLQEAVRMNPNNVLLDAQVNALAIRLSEIEEQQSVHDSMPKNRKILVVDDSPTVRKLISGKLEKCGHEVICAIDGVDALEKINELLPDLILLDITMPRMDGYQVCKMIRSNETTKDVPVVMISGKDGFFDKVRGKMAGTSGYITKPFGPETLMKTVETYFN